MFVRTALSQEQLIYAIQITKTWKMYVNLSHNLYHVPLFHSMPPYSRVSFFRYSHWTRRWTRLLIDGGTPLEATHRYAAICSRLTLVMCSNSPSTTLTGIEWNDWLLQVMGMRRRSGNVESQLLYGKMRARKAYHVRRQLAFLRHPRDATWHTAPGSLAPCTSMRHFDPPVQPYHCWSCPRQSWEALRQSES